jgi:hypothetical protein
MGHLKIYQDYLTDDPTYGPTLFRQRFVCIRLILLIYDVHNNMDVLFFLFCRYRMNRDLFLHIMHAVEDHDEYFVQKRNAATQSD